MLCLINRTAYLTSTARIIINPSSIVIRKYCQSTDEITKKATIEKGGFAKAFEKLENINNQENKPTEPELFTTLFKNSKFVELGDPENKIVVGKIFHVVDNDLYIDFGWKFHCVCTRPAKNGSAYVRGSRVKLRIKDLEISSKFLGSAKELTLMEADCQLLGLLSSPTTPRVKA